VSAVAQPLPRGRHRLSRDEVVRSQRERLQRALAEAMAEKGYAGTSVAEVLRIARVSRETFYEQFASKEECFMSVFEEAYERLAGAATAPGDLATGATPQEWFALVLRVYLDALAAEPAFARVFLIEVYAAGPQAMARRAELQSRLVDAVAAATRTDRFATEALLAAISALVTARLAAGDINGLRELHAPVCELARKVWDA
jgi:AcrR family transcriptional regulator